MPRFAIAVLAVYLTACAVSPTDSAVSTPRVVAAERALMAGEYRYAAEQYAKAALATEDIDTLAAAVDVGFEFGENTTTQRVIDRWHRVEPANPTPWLAAARLALRDADRPAAKDAFVQFLGLSTAPYPDRAQAYERLGNSLVVNTNRVLAIGVAEDVAAAFDSDWRAFKMLSQVALARDELTLALEAAEQAFELAPDSFDAGLLQAQAIVLGGDRSAGLEFAEYVLDNADPSIDDRLNYARLLSSSESVDEAINVVDAVLDDDPGNADAIAARAILDLRSGELERAWERFSRLANERSHRHDAVFFLGNIAERSGRSEQARRIYSQIGEGPNAVIAQQRISALLLGEGNRDAALAHLADYRRRHPDDGFAISVTEAQLLREVGQTDKAIEVYDRLLAIRPEGEGLKLTRAEAVLAAGDVERAVRLYREALKQHPDSALSLNALGYTLADRTDRYDEAFELIQRAFELEPDNPAIIDSMGWVEFKLGRYENALAHLERAWAIMKDPEVAAHLGETLWQLGERDRARAILKEAYDRNPDSEPLRRTLERLLEQDARVES
ncbi:MAG: tetratricopeptide repeat protein [Pseudomonadota bacterium]